MRRALVIAGCIAVAGCSSGGHQATSSSSTVEQTSVFAGPAATASIACPSYAFRPQSSDLAGEITATGTSCQVATQVVAAAPDRPHAYTGYSAGGFTCTAGTETQPPGGGISQVPYRCHDPAGATITFNHY